MYRDGQGVPQDYVRAYMCSNLAAQSSEPADVPGHYSPAQIAKMGRDDVARHMTTAQIADARDLELGSELINFSVLTIRS